MSYAKQTPLIKVKLNKIRAQILSILKTVLQQVTCLYQFLFFQYDSEKLKYYYIQKQHQIKMNGKVSRAKLLLTTKSYIFIDNKTIPEIRHTACKQTAINNCIVYTASVVIKTMINMSILDVKSFLFPAATAHIFYYFFRLYAIHL